MKAAHCDQNYS